ncbi:hypothetical protein DRQ09_05165 [candidate division KSB1 bacterium]|nr:MAG: hypothetical protein DRQ09_05165 [candidate division KSB1 bacterium]
MRKSFLIYIILVLFLSCSRTKTIKISEKDWLETQLNIEALYFNSLSFPYSVRINSVFINDYNKVEYELMYSDRDFNLIKKENPEGTITRDIEIFNKFINTTIQKYEISFKETFDYRKDIVCRVQVWDNIKKTHKDVALLENGIFKMLDK